jgi:hypothetical protein
VRVVQNIHDHLCISSNLHLAERRLVCPRNARNLRSGARCSAYAHQNSMPLPSNEACIVR